MANHPEYEGDLYDEGHLRDSYPAYRQIRDCGSAVWMPQREMWAIGRFEDVRAALRADDVLISGKGVAANDAINAQPPPITLMSDADVHNRRRLALMQPIMPGPLKELRPRLEREADQLIDGLVTGETFDAMTQFASHLPVSVIAELVGLNEVGRSRMLHWAAASFDALGVMNERGVAAMPDLIELTQYTLGLDRDTVAAGGWAARLFDAADRGELAPEEAKSMVIDYVGPALDTTILSTGHMLWRLATTPGAYDALRAEPQLISSVVNEAVRLASPIRGFTRFAVEDFELGSQVIPKGSRVLILFASANRDERHYPQPDSFDIRRNPRDHMGWGHGPHTCVGMHLARLEMEVLLKSLVARVERLEVDEPQPIWNNVLQGFRSLPARFHPALA